MWCRSVFTAGDWDVGQRGRSRLAVAGIRSSAQAFGGLDTFSQRDIPSSALNIGITTATQRVNVTATTTVWVVAEAALYRHGDGDRPPLGRDGWVVRFVQIASGVDTVPVLLNLARADHLWDRNPDRRLYPGTPHAAMTDITVRYMPESEVTMESAAAPASQRVLAGVA